MRNWSREELIVKTYISTYVKHDKVAFIFLENVNI